MRGEKRQRPTIDWIDRIDWSLAGLAAAGLVLVVFIALSLGGGPDRALTGETGDPTGSAEATELEERAGTGPHELGGRVTDASGRAVATAWVTAELELGPGTKGRAPAADAEVQDEKVIARSDARGEFTLRGMAAGRHRLRVEGAGLLTAEVRFVEAPGPTVRILVARRAEVRGRVVDGAPVAGATVRLLPLGGAAPLEAETDRSGAFSFDELPEGRYRVWAARGDRAAPARAIDRVGPGPFAPLELALVPAAIVKGRVVDGASGRGVAAQVSLIADDPDEPPRAAQSAADGGFRIDGVPLGGWTADAFAPGYVSAESVRFRAGSGYAPKVALERGGILAGRVVDGTGAPVAGAVVLARSEGSGADVSQESVDRRLGAGPSAWGNGWEAPLAAAAPSGSGSGLLTATGLRFIPRGELGVVVGPLPYPPPPGAVSSAVRIASPLGRTSAPARQLPVDPALEPRFTTDRAGRFRLTGLSPGRYRVLASHPDFADGSSEPHDMDLGRAHEQLEVVLRGGLTLRGLVVDERGAGIAGATVTARGARAGPDPRASRTDRSGRYRLGPLGTDVRVEVSAPGRASAWREIELGPVGDAPVREENFTLVEANASLSGRVSDAGGLAVRGATVRVVAGGAAGAPRAVTDAGGRFRLSGLVGGQHVLRVEHPDYPPAEQEVATGSEAELRLDFGGGVAVEVRDRSGAAVAGAQVVARGPDGATQRATTARDGTAELSPLAAGPWTIKASARGHAVTAVEVEVASGSRPGQVTGPSVRLELAPGAILAGVVRDHSGERVAGAAVSAGDRRATSDRDGRFRLTQVETGPVTLEAEKEGARGAVDLDLAPGDELVTLELRLE